MLALICSETFYRQMNPHREHFTLASCLWSLYNDALGTQSVTEVTHTLPEFPNYGSDMLGLYYAISLSSYFKFQLL